MTTSNKPVRLSVQMFDGLENVEGLDNIPYCQRLNVNSWEIDIFDLVSLRYEFISDDITDVLGNRPWSYATELFVRRFKGALNKALKEYGSWSTTDSLLTDLKNDKGENLSQLGVIAVRYLSENGNHTHIELLCENGDIITCPSKCHILWSPASYVVKHLNSLEWHGTWADKSSWSCFDHLLSHGH